MWMHACTHMHMGICVCVRTCSHTHTPTPCPPPHIQMCAPTLTRIHYVCSCRLLNTHIRGHVQEQASSPHRKRCHRSGCGWRSGRPGRLQWPPPGRTAGAAPHARGSRPAGTQPLCQMCLGLCGREQWCLQAGKRTWVWISMCINMCVHMRPSTTERKGKGGRKGR